MSSASVIVMIVVRAEIRSVVEYPEGEVFGCVPPVSLDAARITPWFSGDQAGNRSGLFDADPMKVNERPRKPLM